MTWTLIAHTVAGSPTGPTVTTSAIDTTGADFLVVVVGYYAGGGTRHPVVSDSKVGNTWIPLTAREESVGSANGSQIIYCKNPASVGTGHTFTLNSVGGNTLCSIAVAAFKGSDLTSPFDVENGATTTGATSIQPGLVTPGATAELIITGLGTSSPALIEAIDSGFTLLDQVDQSATNFGCALAYKIKTDTLAENPLWTWTGGTSEGATTIATFRVAPVIVTPSPPSALAPPRVLPLQPPVDFKRPPWTKPQQDDLVRIWQDLVRYINQFIGPLPRGGVDVTSQVLCNVTLIQFGPDQGIVSVFVGPSTMVVSIHCSFNVSVAPVDFIDLTLPFPINIFPDSVVEVAADFTYQDQGVAAMKSGVMYQGLTTEKNHINLYRNDFTQWPVNVNNIYIAGQIILPLVGTGV